MSKKITKENIALEDIRKLKCKKEQLNLLKEKLEYWNQKSLEIQSKFDFIIPNYIIGEIIEKEKSKDYLNLYYLINCAIINGRISESNGKKLKQLYSIKQSYL